MTLSEHVAYPIYSGLGGGEVSAEMQGEQASPDEEIKKYSRQGESSETCSLFSASRPWNRRQHMVRNRITEVSGGQFIKKHKVTLRIQTLPSRKRVAGNGFKMEGGCDRIRFILTFKESLQLQ